MKKVKISKYFGILLFITMLTLIVIASTYAKYTSNFTGTGSATAADWSVTVDGENAETHEVTFTSNTKIYPGLSNVELGKVKVTNSSTLVSAKVASITAVAGSSTPKNITLSTGSSSTIIGPGESVEVPVYATWAYTTDNETSLANSTITFDLSLTVDQVVAE